MIPERAPEVPGQAPEAGSAIAPRLSRSPFIDKRIGSYRTTQLLGRGGFGEVLLAVHEQMEAQRAAVKVLYPHLADDENLVTRFFNEARAVGMVKHPGLVKIFDFGTLDDGTVYILMELLEGETLSERMKRLKRSESWFSLSETLRLLRQIASALAAVHEQGIYHRDIKPDNVFIVSEPEAAGRERAKLLDFGIAKFRDAKSHTSTGEPMGTVWYMSPEQCRGEKIDGKTDVYSLGILLYEMVAGRLPFQSAVLHAVMFKHLTTEPPLLNEVIVGIPEKIHVLVHQMLAKDPQARPTMADVLSQAEALEQTFFDHTTPKLTGAHDRVRAASDDLGLVHTRRGARVRRALLLAAAAAGLSAMILVGWFVGVQRRLPVVRTPVPITAPVPAPPSRLPSVPREGPRVLPAAAPAVSAPATTAVPPALVPAALTAVSARAATLAAATSKPALKGSRRSRALQKTQSAAAALRPEDGSATPSAVQPPADRVGVLAEPESKPPEVAPRPAAPALPAPALAAPAGAAPPPAGEPSHVRKTREAIY